MPLRADTWKHIRRSPYQSMAAILSMFLTMLLAGLFFLATGSSILVLQYFESKPQITVFFTDSATEEDAVNLQKTLEGTQKVAATKYVSKEDALVIYREQNKNDPLLLEMVTADILPASLEVSAIDPSYLNDLEPVVKDAKGVEEVVFQKDVVDSLISWTRAIRMVGMVLVGLFSVNSILIMMTVIGMKIALKKEEIEILTLIGASPGYIRMPFVLEGGVYGAIGSFVAWLITIGVLEWLSPVLSGFLGMIPVFSEVFNAYFSTPFLLLGGFFLGIMLLAGFLLGSIGSLIALGRYLKF